MKIATGIKIKEKRGHHVLVYEHLNPKKDPDCVAEELP